MALGGVGMLVCYSVLLCNSVSPVRVRGVTPLCLLSVLSVFGALRFSYEAKLQKAGRKKNCQTLTATWS